MRGVRYASPRTFWVYYGAGGYSACILGVLWSWRVFRLHSWHDTAATAESTQNTRTMDSGGEFRAESVKMAGMQAESADVADSGWIASGIRFPILLMHGSC